MNIITNSFICLNDLVIRPNESFVYSNGLLICPKEFLNCSNDKLIRSNDLLIRPNKETFFFIFGLFTPPYVRNRKPYVDGLL